MYDSYGSYSSMGAGAGPMDIISNNLGTNGSACAFPSWPRRPSLSDSEGSEPRPTSFLSDDDLCMSDPFDDDAHSVSCSSTSTSTRSSPHAPTTEPPHPERLSVEHLLQLERERVAMQREFVRQVKLEKERRRQSALRARRNSPKKNTKGKTAGLTTIAEGSE
ncbi:hypothetical protein DCS_07319 [Drechmeria coniospora]|uniref:Uncharacterized protein n=1 Tax=Drechmeria coniospora TaxID=98403 RepID=A0A151GE43_DRECN|nr:hypothetical protein DCS_07319 [Drechmeria coniospora]KYK55356.1 hypothetical protein DCS_07319 [Drechmeria coniospora]ODA82037.1 hypothetical protein RJ55_00542 [Drechmeria coniospora]